ncbi:FecR domain-containing protein [Phenylobacterium sp.]|uniref:FecR family protein n=1 Tax=Phenylobacterium sp. TaxID=1871053 RepID=UPI0028A2562A|nr:FecR domain-containing protein [Phenylobacterium sp.]
MASAISAGIIDEQAARWAVEAACGELTAEGRAELEVWLAADRRHRGAYARARAVFLAMEDAVVGGRPPARASMPVLVHEAAAPAAARPPPPRRGMFFGAALAASFTALVVVGALVASRPQPSAPAVEHVVKLQDGSVATLQRDARIDVVLSQDARRITLLSGSATFRVAKDQARPFVVRAGEVSAQATGTVYSVGRVGPRGGTVKVLEGGVLVWPGEAREQAVLLRAGQSLTLDPPPQARPRPEKVASRGPARPAASPQIALDDTPIGVAVTRFNRINGTKIVLADPAIGDIRIVGLFKTDDPDEFARMAAAISGGEVERGDGVIIIKLR